MKFGSSKRSTSRPGLGGLLARIPEPRAAVAGGAAAVRRRRWSRFMPPVIAMLAIIATLAGILVLNIKVSDGQYRLVELRAQERSLAQEAEALNQDLEFYQAPQNLAVSARDEGMVPSTSEGVVDLNSGEVSGDPVPAAESEDDEILVDQPVQRGSAAADRAAAIARERRDALPNSQSEADEQLGAANEAEGDVDLNGGSIPAPQQRKPSGQTASPSPSGETNQEAGQPGTDQNTDQNDEQNADQGANAQDSNAQDGGAQ